jgi:hypothetical protein
MAVSADNGSPVQDTNGPADGAQEEIESLGQDNDTPQSADDVSGGGSEAAASAEPVASTISEEMQSLARDYGMDPDAFGSDGNIRAAVAMLDRQAAEWAKASPQYQERAKAVPPTQKGPAEITQQQPSQFDFDKLFPKDQIDETLAGSLRALYQHLEGLVTTKTKGFDEFGQLKEQLGTLQQYHQQQEAMKFESEVDGCFRELGDEWKATFGKSPMAAIPNGSPLKQARQQLVDQIDALQHADLLRNRPLRPVRHYFDAALRSAFSQQTDTAARRQVLKDLGQGKNKALARGNSKTITKLSPEDRARATLRAKMQQYGMTVDTVDDED